MLERILKEITPSDGFGWFLGRQIFFWSCRRPRLPKANLFFSYVKFSSGDTESKAAFHEKSAWVTSVRFPVSFIIFTEIVNIVCIGKEKTIT